MARVHFKQVQRFILVNKIFLGLGALKKFEHLILLNIHGS